MQKHVRSRDSLGTGGASSCFQLKQGHPKDSSDDGVIIIVMRIGKVIRLLVLSENKCPTLTVNWL